MSDNDEKISVVTTGDPPTPPLATHSKLRHINEVIVVEFYFGHPDGGGVKVGEVSLGLSASMELLLNIFEEVFKLFPGFQGSIENFNQRLAKIAVQANQIRGG